MDLELAGADRHLHPVAVAARLGERLRDRRLGHAVEAQHAAHAAARAREQPLKRRGLEHARPELPAARAAARAARPRRAAATSSTSAGAVPTRPTTSAPSGSVACLSTPGSKSAYGRPSRSATSRERLLDLAAQLLVDREPDAGRTREQLDRAVVVRRPEPARDDEQVVPRAPRASAAERSAGSSPTIVIRAGSMPSRSSDAARNGPFRSFRSPRTSSEPDATIAARGRLRCRPPTGRRDDDHLRLRARHMHELAADRDAEVLRRVDRAPTAAAADRAAGSPF